MLHLLSFSRAYPPETIAAMSSAFDLVCQCLAKPISDNDTMRKKIALTILRHVDEGERDPTRLATVALREMAGSDRSEIDAAH